MSKLRTLPLSDPDINNPSTLPTRETAAHARLADVLGPGFATDTGHQPVRAGYALRFVHADVLFLGCRARLLGFSIPADCPVIVLRGLTFRQLASEHL